MVRLFPLVIRLITLVVMPSTIGAAWAQETEERTSSEKTQLSPESSPAAIETILLRFTFSAPSTCPNKERALWLMQKHSPRIKIASDAPEALGISIRRESEGVVGVLRVTRAAGTIEERTIVGAHCKEVVEALALTAALSVDPNATLALPSPSEEAAQSPNTEQSEKIAQSPDEDDAAAIANDGRTFQAEPARWGVGAQISLQNLLTPGLHLGPGLEVTLSKASARVFFPLEFFLSASPLFALPTEENESIRTRFALLRLGYCPLRVGKRLAFLLCPTTQLGIVNARGVDLSNSSSSTRFFATLGASARLRAQLHPHLEWVLMPSLDAALSQREFAALPGPQTLATTRSWSWALSSSLIASF